MPPKPKANKAKGKGKGDDEEDKVKEIGKILNNEIKTMQQRIGNSVPPQLSPRRNQGESGRRECGEVQETRAGHKSDDREGKAREGTDHVFDGRRNQANGRHHDEADQNPGGNR